LGITDLPHTVVFNRGTSQEVRKPRQNITQADLVTLFGTNDPGNKFSCNGTVRADRKFETVIAPPVGMGTESLSWSDFTTDWIKTKLNSGPIYLAYELPDAAYVHVVIAYDCIVNSGSTSIKIMNPLPVDKGGGLLTININAYKDSKFTAGVPVAYVPRPDEE
jgi:hypothetical protein